MTATWGLIIDVARCHDCNNCFLACKDEFIDNDFPGYSQAQPKQRIIKGIETALMPNFMQRKQLSRATQHRSTHDATRRWGQMRARSASHPWSRPSFLALAALTR